MILLITIIIAALCFFVGLLSGICIGMEGKNDG